MCVNIRDSYLWYKFICTVLSTFIKRFLPQVIDHAFDDKAGQAFDDDHQRAGEEYDGIC